MNILIFNWRCWKHPWAGGAENYLHEISKRLVRDGHMVTWFVSSGEGLKEREVLDGIAIIRKGGRFSVYIHAFITYIMELRSGDFDVIVDDINGVPFFTPLFVRKRKIAIIHHLVKGIFFKELPFYSAVLGWLSERMIPIVYKRTKFVTVSESSKRELEEFGIADIEVVYNGVDMVQSGNSDKNLRPAIIFLGRLKRYKRIDLLIKAYKIVSERVPETELWIVGDGDHRKELEQLAGEMKIKADFSGYVDEATKAKLLREAWVFVITSEKEGWGVTVIEANACGTPCIAYDVPGLRDSIIDEETGILVRADGDVEDLAEAIIMVLEDDELRETLSKNALEYAKRFSWDISAEMFERVLMKLKDGR
jgi:glycosyltransferase involved in cell wall biosynthesis